MDWNSNGGTLGCLGFELTFFSRIINRSLLCVYVCAPSAGIRKPIINCMSSCNAFDLIVILVHSLCWRKPKLADFAILDRDVWVVRFLFL